MDLDHLYSGTLYTISAPSGAGKTSLVKALVESVDNIQVSVSHTTRFPRQGEKNGVDYHFVDENTFMDMVEKTLFLEHAQIFDYYYGTSQKEVFQLLARGIDVILEIDWQGAQQVRRIHEDSVGIFILPPSLEALERRLRARGKDSEEVIARRMRKAEDEMSHYIEFDYLVINDKFSSALKDLQTIVECQRLSHRVQTQKNQDLLMRLFS
jgi:guanylate kinase